MRKTSMDELANILANHSQFPIAWIQKLYMWGNSQRCEETDDEFKRIMKFLAHHYLQVPAVQQLMSKKVLGSAWRAVITCQCRAACLGQYR